VVIKNFRDGRNVKRPKLVSSTAQLSTIDRAVDLRKIATNRAFFGQPQLKISQNAIFDGKTSFFAIFERRSV